ncbi:f-box lrr-repeat protein 14-like [Lynx pardinus]|uniref:RNA transcription, translation and transport factor protein n=1 Tax=Lynx pardinus TaxID=191816 RepID=A0A485MCP4_LYNPA|nr:f-box lrr-repeat protein 14-like [Lynx pardinus]
MALRKTKKSSGATVCCRQGCKKCSLWGKSFRAWLRYDSSNGTHGTYPKYGDRPLQALAPDQKIKHHKIEGRGSLRNIHSSDWSKSFEKYLRHVNCPFRIQDQQEVIDWLLGLAVRLEYGDNAEKYKGLLPDNTKNADSVEALINLDENNPDLKAGVMALANFLQIQHLNGYLIRLSCIKFGCYNLTDNGLGHAFVQEIGSLRALNLSLCKQITDSSLGRIAQYLKGLEVLELGGCSNITNTGLLLIAWGLQRLKSLNLRSCRHLSDVGIGHLAGMTRSAAEGCLGLEQLTLQDCQKLTDLSLKHISRGLTGLRLLNLSFCGGISDAGLLHLSHMGSLRSLNLRSCDNISDTGIMHLAMGSLRLSGLDVSFCDKVGDQSLAYIAQGLDGLKSLSLCSCHISDDGINRMVRQMHGLRTLNIGQCVRITDKGLELIAEHLSQLTGIDLYGCTRITKRGLERITQLPCLKVLNLGLWQMTDSEKVSLLFSLKPWNSTREIF